ncbi:MAG: hypothetical protein RLZZ627_2069, partial [Pseudomonadota bacterium]
DEDDSTLAFMGSTFDRKLFQKGIWQARRVSNPQPAVLETAALPIELLTYTLGIWRDALASRQLSS